MKNSILRVKDLRVSFSTDEGEVEAVRGVDLEVCSGETLALVGESGCGKSTIALSIMNLIEPPGRIVGGSVIYKGRDLTCLSREEMSGIRGRAISMIFQEPMTSLNPVLSIGRQISEVVELHQGLSRSEATRRAFSLLETVGISSPKERLKQYPHELSGGMKQRVMIAIALACRPALLIADEPTTALDVTVQAQILDLLQRLQQEMGLAILLITHNLGVVAQFAEHVAVMYGGEVVEQAPVHNLFGDPSHPYTRALLRALPQPSSPNQRLESIAGTVPSPLYYPTGCSFFPRCSEALERCENQAPPLIEIESNHKALCWLHGGNTSDNKSQKTRGMDKL